MQPVLHAPLLILKEGHGTSRSALHQRHPYAQSICTLAKTIPTFGISPPLCRQKIIPVRTSNLFYQTRQRRPEVDRAEGIYILGKNGERFIDSSFGAMVSNIGHSNPNVLAAMKARMDSATFAYRLHFENSAAEDLPPLLPTGSPRG